MPWDEWSYPVSMRRLAPPTRAKAIEIANALLGEGMDEGRAIRIAIARAKAWALRRGLPTRLDRADAGAWGSTARWLARPPVTRGSLSLKRRRPKR